MTFSASSLSSLRTRIFISLILPIFTGYGLTFDGLDAGNVKTGIKDYHESHKLDIWKREECLDCEYLPMCYGGCRYLKLLRDGHIDGVDCKKPQFDATLETLVKQDLKYSSHRVF